jgi:hypothetical protein
MPRFQLRRLEERIAPSSCGCVLLPHVTAKANVTLSPSGCGLAKLGQGSYLQVGNIVTGNCANLGPNGLFTAFVLRSASAGSCG